MTRKIYRIVFMDGTAARNLGDQDTEPARIAAKLSKPVKWIECDGVVVWPAVEAMKARIKRAQEKYLEGAHR